MQQNDKEKRLLIGSRFCKCLMYNYYQYWI